MTIDPTPSELLTWAEICARYPDQWVVLVDIEWVDEDDRDVRAARVAGHGKTRREPLIQARIAWSRPREIAHLYTGLVRAPAAIERGCG